MIHLSDGDLDPARDYADLFRTARVVRKLNPHVPWSSDAEGVEFMVNFARQHCHKEPGYAGTYGFYVTTYREPSGNGLAVKATVAAWLFDKD